MKKKSSSKKFLWFTIFYLVSIAIALFLGGRYFSSQSEAIASFLPKGNPLVHTDTTIKLTQVGKNPEIISFNNLKGQITNNSDHVLQNVRIEFVTSDSNGILLDECHSDLNMEIPQGSTAEFQAYCSLDSRTKINVSKVSEMFSVSGVNDLTFEQIS